jgi:hypothetical protein
VGETFDLPAASSTTWRLFKDRHKTSQVFLQNGSLKNLGLRYLTALYFSTATFKFEISEISKKGMVTEEYETVIQCACTADKSLIVINQSINQSIESSVKQFMD